MNLSSKGQEAFQISHQVFFDWDRQMLEGLTEEEQTQLFAILEKVTRKEANLPCMR